MPAADARPVLGPRSLPLNPFLGAVGTKLVPRELIRDPTTPDDFCNCHDVRALGPGLFVSSRSWKEASTSVPILTHRAPSPRRPFERCPLEHLGSVPTRGEPRSIWTTQSRRWFLQDLSRFAHERTWPAPSSLESPSRGGRALASAVSSCAPEPDPSLRPLRDKKTASARARDMTVRGSLDRVKDASPRRGAGGAARLGCVRLGSRTPTTFPSSASRGHPTVAGATARRGGVPLRTRRTGLGLRSRGAPRRATRSWRPGCLPPSRPRGERAIGLLRTTSPRAGLLLAPPTLFPQAGEKCRWSGIASCAHPSREGPRTERDSFGERAPL